MREIDLTHDRASSLSVFVPVHNEENYLKATLNSVREAEEFYSAIEGRLKVVVSINGSSDRSLEIAETFLVDNKHWDLRIIETALDGEQHFNRLIQSCNTEYLCIVGGHDLVSQRYFYELEKLMKKSTESPLCFSREFVDFAGNGIDAFEANFRYRFSSKDETRFWQSIFYLGNATCIQGIVRTDLIKAIQALGTKTPDLVWLHGLLEHGPIVYSDNASYIRTNPLRATDFVPNKIKNLKSAKISMDKAALEAWSPRGSSRLKLLLARFVLTMKFSSSVFHQGVFQILRKVSQMFLVPPCRRKLFSNSSEKVVEILRH
jgi:hypothetical protein